MCKVSIVLPTYNGEKFIRQAIEGILGQNYTDWELIIVDDCSTDQTNTIATEYAKKDNRIQIIRNESNMKLPLSLNIGFQYAKGKYLTWTSDDNVFLKDAIGAMVEFLDENANISMVCTGMLRIDENNKVICENPQYCEDRMYIGNAVGASFLYHRDVLETIGGYDPTMFCVEDYDYWLKILISGKKIGFLRGCYYLYREHGNSLTMTKKDVIQKQMRLLYLKNFDWIIKGIWHDKERMMFLYNRLIVGDEMDFEIIKKKFIAFLPAIEGNVKYNPEGRFIIYGAGEKGMECLKELKDKAKCFADKDKEKIGGQINGLIIIEPDEMLKMSLNNGYDVIVAVGYEKQYSVLEELKGKGLKKFVLMSQI